jgi:hypothetical protein
MLPTNGNPTLVDIQTDHFSATRHIGLRKKMNYAAPHAYFRRGAPMHERCAPDPVSTV